MATRHTARCFCGKLIPKRPEVGDYQAEEARYHHEGPGRDDHDCPGYVTAGTTRREERDAWLAELAARGLTPKTRPMADGRARCAPINDEEVVGMLAATRDNLMAGRGPRWAEVGARFDRSATCARNIWLHAAARLGADRFDGWTGTWQEYAKHRARLRTEGHLRAT